MKRLKLCGAVTAGLLMSASANAEIRFNGFASLFGGFTTGSGDQLLGYDDSFSADPDTLVGLQAVADLEDKLSVTVQLTARGAEDYEVDLEWGYLSYQLTDQVRINAGRIRVPFFNRSDFLDVGYAYYWVRPPELVYNVSFSNLTGASILYNFPVGNWDITAQVLAGRNSTATINVAGQEADFEAENFIGGSVEFNRDWFTGRLGYFRANVSLDSDLVNGGTGNIRNAGFDLLADNLAIDNDTGTFIHAGVSIDKNDFLFNAEWRLIEVEESILQERPAWYASIGYRIGAWTPNITYEEIETEVPRTIQNLIAGAPPPIVAGASALLGGLSADESAVSVGVRYDFHPSAAFKIDYTSFSDNIDATLDADLLTFGVDLVF
jgi:hypothetical protein